MRSTIVRSFHCRDEPTADVDVRNDSDAQAVELLRPVVDLDRLLANYEPVRFD